MFYQVNYEKRKVLVQDVIDRLTRLNAEQTSKYLKALETLHEKYNVNSSTDELGVRYYPSNDNQK
jgi:hypothetical protein